VSSTVLALKPATEIRDGLAAGECTAVDVAEASLAQVAEHNDRLNAVVTFNERFLDDARALDERRARGEEVGPLFGLPVGIKDVTPVAGLRTTYGSTAYADHVPTEDALVVERLRDAGALILGKTNCPEFAAGGATFNDVFGRTRNPWNLDKTPGGSTGGGAAGLVTGMIALAEGTDLGGSLRIPASFSGVCGIRPSPGLIPTVPADYLYDPFQVTGPMARQVSDLGLALDALSGPDPRSPLSQPTAGRDFEWAARNGNVEGMRFAYCPDAVGIGIDPEVEAVCRAAAESLADSGAVVEEISLDLSYAWQAFLDFRGYWFVAQMRNRTEHMDSFGPNVAGNIRSGMSVTAEALGAAEGARGQLWTEFAAFFGRFDALLTPCMAVPPFDVESNYPVTVAGRPMKTYIDWVAPTFVLSLTSLPVACVPAGLDPSGLPVGLQVMGPQFGEERALAVAAAVQRSNPLGSPLESPLNSRPNSQPESPASG
jgi:amidase